jgi:hypothetical protein
MCSGRQEADLRIYLDKPYQVKGSQLFDFLAGLGIPPQVWVSGARLGLDGVEYPGLFARGDVLGTQFISIHEINEVESFAVSEAVILLGNQ